MTDASENNRTIAKCKDSGRPNDQRHRGVMNDDSYNGESDTVANSNNIYFQTSTSVRRTILVIIDQIYRIEI